MINSTAVHQHQQQLADLPPTESYHKPATQLSSHKLKSTIISHVTEKLASLKSLTQNSDLQATDFQLFTHHKKRLHNVPLQKSYKDLREAILELYLSVRVRQDDEIDQYNEDMFKVEKIQLAHLNGFDLVDHVKESIEQLMNLQQQLTMGGAPEIETVDLPNNTLGDNQKSLTTSSLKELEHRLKQIGSPQLSKAVQPHRLTIEESDQSSNKCSNYLEAELRKAEAENRNHINQFHQLKIQLETVQDQLTSVLSKNQLFAAQDKEHQKERFLLNEQVQVARSKLKQQEESIKKLQAELVVKQTKEKQLKAEIRQYQTKHSVSHQEPPIANTPKVIAQESQNHAQSTAVGSSLLKQQQQSQQSVRSQSHLKQQQSSNSIQPSQQITLNIFNGLPTNSQSQQDTTNSSIKDLNHKRVKSRSFARNPYQTEEQQPQPTTSEVLEPYLTQSQISSASQIQTPVQQQQAVKKLAHLKQVSTSMPQSQTSSSTNQKFVQSHTTSAQAQSQAQKPSSSQPKKRQQPQAKTTSHSHSHSQHSSSVLKQSTSSANILTPSLVSHQQAKRLSTDNSYSVQQLQPSLYKGQPSNSGVQQVAAQAAKQLMTGVVPQSQHSSGSNPNVNVYFNQIGSINNNSTSSNNNVIRTAKQQKKTAAQGSAAQKAHKQTSISGKVTKSYQHSRSTSTFM